MGNPLKTIDQSDNLYRAIYLDMEKVVDFVIDLIQSRKHYAQDNLNCKPGSRKYLFSLKGINTCDNELRKLLAINLNPLSLKRIIPLKAVSPVGKVA